MFESLSDKLKKTLKNLRGAGRLTPEHVDVALREIRMALLEADVNYKVAKDFVESVRIKAEGEEVWNGLKPHEQVVKIVYDELSTLMGGTSSRLVFTPAKLTGSSSVKRGHSKYPAPTSAGMNCRRSGSDGVMCS